MAQEVVVSALTYGCRRTDHNSYPCIPTPGVPTTCLVGVLYPYSDFFRFVGTFHIHACTLPFVSILTSEAMDEASREATWEVWPRHLARPFGWRGLGVSRGHLGGAA